MDGSVDNSCTDDGGVCTCIANVSEDKCDVCTTGWYGFPTCQGEITDMSLNMFALFLLCLKNVFRMSM